MQKEIFRNEKDVKLKTLEVLKNQDVIFRLETKIVYRENLDDFRKPVILPLHQTVARRLIFFFFYHVTNSHAEYAQILLSILREHFRILNDRNTVRSVLSKCTKCKRYSRKNLDVQLTCPKICGDWNHWRWSCWAVAFKRTIINMNLYFHLCNLQSRSPRISFSCFNQCFSVSLTQIYSKTREMFSALLQ